MSKSKWRKYAYEFLSIFVAVIAALALNNWNDNRRDRLTEQEILTEIRRGLEDDINDININMFGHQAGIAACDYFAKLANGERVPQDSFPAYYFNLTRDFISIQNRSGYQSLQSMGLDLIQNKETRYKIISIYEYDYESGVKLEESYAEAQFYENYAAPIRDILTPYLSYGDSLQIRIAQPLQLPPTDKNKFLDLLWRIKQNRSFILRFYEQLKLKVESLSQEIAASK